MNLQTVLADLSGLSKELGALKEERNVSAEALIVAQSDLAAAQTRITELEGNASKAKAEAEEAGKGEKSKVDQAIEALWAEYQAATKAEEGEEVPEEEKPEEPKEDEPAASALARIGKGFAKHFGKLKAANVKLAEEAKTAGPKQIARIGLPAPVAVKKGGEKPDLSNLTGFAKVSAAFAAKKVD